MFVPDRMFSTARLILTLPISHSSVDDYEFSDIPNVKLTGRYGAIVVFRTLLRGLFI